MAKSWRPSPSMRRPVDVKVHFRFLLSVSLFPFSQAASVAILPSALFVERYSLGASWVFSFQKVLLPENRPLFPPFLWELGPRT
jgi:hypothetical protein